MSFSFSHSQCWFSDSHILEWRYTFLTTESGALLDLRSHLLEVWAKCILQSLWSLTEKAGKKRQETVVCLHHITSDSSTRLWQGLSISIHDPQFGILVSALSVQRDLGPRSWSKGWGKHLDLVIAESWAQPWWLSYNSYKIKMDQDGSRWFLWKDPKIFRQFETMKLSAWTTRTEAEAQWHGHQSMAHCIRRQCTIATGRVDLQGPIHQNCSVMICLTYFWYIYDIYDHSMKSGYVQCAFHAFRSESMTTHPIRRGAACCPLAECTTTWS